jgi:hypothetical protein
LKSKSLREAGLNKKQAHRQAAKRDEALMAAVRLINGPDAPSVSELFPSAIEATELDYWASLGRLERVADALVTNPDVNIRGFGGCTAMHLAACNGHLDVIRFLADHGADLNLRIDTGETPLDLAVLAGEHAAAELVRSLGGKHAEQAAAPDPARG